MDQSLIHPYGVVLGRFQPVHVGHVEFITAAKGHCRHLVIGITNPDLMWLDPTVDDPARSQRAANPFTFFERMRMIEATCFELGWSRHEFSVVPAPITRPQSLHQYLPPPEISVCLATIYDRWGETKKVEMEHLGYPVHVLWRRTMDQRAASGTGVRASMRGGDDRWRDLVPPAVVDLLARWSARLAVADTTDSTDGRR